MLPSREAANPGILIRDVYSYFQLRKIIVEKKRRERIDTALKQLKDMLFGGSELQVRASQII